MDLMETSVFNHQTHLSFSSSFSTDVAGLLDWFGDEKGSPVSALAVSIDLYHNLQHSKQARKRYTVNLGYKDLRYKNTRL
jgi:hypothetical protein